MAHIDPATGILVLEEPDKPIDPERLYREAAEAIDTSWHHSWHWDRDRELSWNPITLKGWRKAADDARGRIYAVNEQLRALKIVLPKIEEQIARMERWERQDAEAEAEESPAA